MIHIFISFLWSGLNEAHCTNEDMKVVMQACFFVLAWWELCWETGNEGESWGLTWKCSHKQTKRNFFNKKTKLFIILAPGLFIFLFWRQRIISENWSYVFISWLVCLIYCAHFRFYVFFLWAFVQALSSLIVWTNFIWSSLLAEL